MRVPRKRVPELLTATARTLALLPSCAASVTSRTSNSFSSCCCTPRAAPTLLNTLAGKDSSCGVPCCLSNTRAGDSSATLTVLAGTSRHWLPSQRSGGSSRCLGTGGMLTSAAPSRLVIADGSSRAQRSQPASLPDCRAAAGSLGRAKAGLLLALSGCPPGIAEPGPARERSRPSPSGGILGLGNLLGLSCSAVTDGGPGEGAVPLAWASSTLHGELLGEPYSSEESSPSKLLAKELASLADSVNSSAHSLSITWGVDAYNALQTAI